MKKKILLLGILLIFVSGCNNINNMTYDEIINTLYVKEKSPNTFKKGYQFYVPKGLSIETSGDNYSIISNVNEKYYLYIDLVSYLNGSNIDYKLNDNAIYSKRINHNKNFGYVEINLWENNQYLIEIMYNYAKIEVMVEEQLINKALVNSINILDSIKYNDKVIERLLNDDELSYTEETYEIFEEEVNNKNDLEYKEDTIVEDKQEDEIKDTDFIN